MDTLILVNAKHRLGEKHVPQGLTDAPLIFKGGNIVAERPGIMLAHCAACALNNMTAAAAREGVRGFLLVSGYRDYAYQKNLYELRKLRGDVTAVNPPGASEHQTGLAADITSCAFPELEEEFEATPHAQWLFANAHKYGFILRYPRDTSHITGVIYEPWHYRFVGAPHAARITERGIVLEEYELAKPARRTKKKPSVSRRLGVFV